MAPKSRCLCYRKETQFSLSIMKSVMINGEIDERAFMMDRNDFLAQKTVAELLRHYPQAATVFLKHRTACVGCMMSGFETLADVAHNYAIDPAGLVSEIKAVVVETDQKPL